MNSRFIQLELLSDEEKRALEELTIARLTALGATNVKFAAATDEKPTAKQENQQRGAA